ncbi:hypothetical protein Y1Q_0001068 [Alligator mississippiensis]|uniref:Uncharacterized protein n=1 Tax=Alligator mississippiensis TaxID=8496 RepID=A0A151NEV3_ALLMI|nr:hypothetical protein Y1Q_0001068 [Alligator mississippiensis]
MHVASNTPPGSSGKQLSQKPEVARGKRREKKEEAFLPHLHAFDLCRKSASLCKTHHNLSCVRRTTILEG